MNVTISTINYEIITADSNTFYLTFNQTNKDLSNLISIGCFINNYNGTKDYYQIVQPKSYKWLLYLIGGIVIFLLIILMKSILVFQFDYITVKYNYQHNHGNFNYSNYLLINLFIASLINQHF
jgi:hypothetical protein